MNARKADKAASVVGCFCRRGLNGGNRGMKILLVCAVGMSSGLLMRKMEKYWREQGKNLVIKSVGLGEYMGICRDYDIVLVGPQVAYRLDQIKADTGMPCDVISALDYAVANCPNLMKLAEKLYASK